MPLTGQEFVSQWKSAGLAPAAGLHNVYYQKQCIIIDPTAAEPLLGVYTVHP